MPQLVLKIRYNKNEGFLVSPTEVMDKYLVGVPLCTRDGRRMPLSAIKTNIAAAQKRFENLFSIRFQRQVIAESKDFNREEFNRWGFIKETFPIRYMGRLWGYINDAVQVQYPHEWLSIKKTTNVAVYRNVYLIPNSASQEGAKMTQNSLIYNGISPHLGWFGARLIPGYWRSIYVTGWTPDDYPEDLADLVIKFALINVLVTIGSFLYGVGIGSISISLDGVSQSTPLKSGKYGIFTDRIQWYVDDINNVFENFKYIYCGITFDVL